MELITAVLDKQLALWTPWTPWVLFWLLHRKWTCMSPPCHHVLFRWQSVCILSFHSKVLRAMRKVLFGSSSTQRHDLFVNSNSERRFYSAIFNKLLLPQIHLIHQKNWSECVIVRKWFPKSIRYIKKPTENRSSLDQKITVGNWGFAASASTELFVFGFPTSAKLRAAKFWGTSWAFAGTVKGMLQSALGLVVPG